MDLPTTSPGKIPDLLMELEEPFVSYVRHIAAEACRRVGRAGYTQLAGEFENSSGLHNSTRRDLLNTIADTVLKVGAPIIRLLDRATPDPSRVGGELQRLLGEDSEMAAIVESLAIMLREDRPDGASRSTLHSVGRVSVLARAQRLVADLRMGPRVRLTDAIAVREEWQVDLIQQLLESVTGLPEAVQNDPAIQAYRGRVLIPWGDAAGAAYCFSIAAQETVQEKERAQLYLDKFYACILADDFDEAMESYERAVEIDPRCEIFDGFRFTPLAIVDAGIWGVAFLCRDQLGGECVVRALEGGALDGQIVFRITEALCRLDTPCLVKSREWGWTDRYGEKGAYLVSGFKGTDTLSERVRTRGPLKQRQAVPFLLTIAQVLEAIHTKKLYHRDLTPDNVFVSEEAGSLMPRLIDCGLSVPSRTLVGYRTGVHESQSLLSRILEHTMLYAPPEQKGLNRGSLGPTCDVYYFGKLSCFALFGRTEPLERHWQSVPANLEALLKSCTAESIDARPTDFTEVVGALEPMAEALVTASFDPSAFDTPETDKNEPASGLFSLLSGFFTTKPSRASDGSNRTSTKAWWRPRKDQKRMHVEHDLALALRNSLDIDFVLIPPGDCKVGSPDSEEGRRLNEASHDATVSRAFYIKATPVTRREWKALMGTRPYFFEKLADDAPIENITWFDAVEFCNRLSQLDGLKKVYRLSDVQTDGTSIKSARVEFLGLDVLGYRLPSEIEWEWACRAGSEEAFWTGRTLSEKQANFSTRGPTPVHKFPPNPWGLYDMHGNVWEWCNDWYTYQPGTHSERGEQDAQRRRSKRGGSWQVPAVLCRSAFRARLEPEFCKNDLGFRPVQPLPRVLGSP